MNCTNCGWEAEVLLTSIKCSNLDCRHFAPSMFGKAKRNVFPYHDSYDGANYMNQSIAFNNWGPKDILARNRLFREFVCYWIEHDNEKYAFHFEKSTLIGELDLFHDHAAETGADIIISCEACPAALLVERFNYRYLFNLLSNYRYEPFHSSKFSDSFMVCGKCAKKVRSLKI